MPTSAGPNIIETGLVLALDAADRISYPGTGTTWSDLSGNSNNGTLTAGPTFNGANGGNIVFDGTDDYCDLGVSSYFTGLINMSISIWVNPQTASTTRWIFGRYDSLNRSQGFLIFHDIDNKFYFDFRESLAAYLRISTTNTYAVNNWYNFTITKSANLHSIYINGVLENSATLGLGNVAWLSNYAQISALFQTPSLGVRYYGKNKIASLYVYNRALSSTEILQNYNATKSRFGLK